MTTLILSIFFASHFAGAQISQLENIYLGIKAAKFAEASRAFQASKCDEDEVCFEGKDQQGKELKILPSEVRLDIALFKSIKFNCDQTTNKGWESFQTDCYQGIEVARQQGKIERIKRISGVDLSAFFSAYDRRHDELKAEEQRKGEERDKIAQKKRAAEEAERKQRAASVQLKNSPEGKKCQAMSEAASSKKMYLMWEQNLNSIKRDAQDAGVFTAKMQADIDQSLSMRRAFLAQKENAEKKIKAMVQVQVTAARCKEILPNFGASMADKYQGEE